MKRLPQIAFLPDGKRLHLQDGPIDLIVEAKGRAPALRACVIDAADDPTISSVASKRLKEMLAFTELVDRWYAQMLTVPRPRLVALMRLGEKIVSFLPAGKSK